jgi:hypothetical protein
MGPGKKVATTTPATTDVTAGWTTYTNSKYSYSFKYPTTEKLTATSGTNDNATISATADAVNVFPSDKTVKDSIFKVSVPSIQLTEAAIKTQFSSEPSANITVTAATVGGVDGFKVVITGDTTVVSTFYFAKNTAGNILELTVLNASTDAKTMLTTFKLTTAAAAATTGTTCTNATYGFTYVRPASWGACKVKEATLTGTTAAYYVEIPTTDKNFAAGDQNQDAGYYSPFAITVYTPAQWAAVQKAGGPVEETLLTQNANYVFTWSQANGIPATDFGTKTNDIKTIIASFKLK